MNIKCIRVEGLKGAGRVEGNYLRDGNPKRVTVLLFG
jgi:hypothetical protein